MIVAIQDDFDLEKIADSGQAFRIVRVGNCWRFVAGARVLHIRQLSAHQCEADAESSEWEKFWKDYFDLGRSYAAVRAAIPQQDHYLRHAAEVGQGIRILRQDPWEMLITFIISQRKSIPAIRSCVEALCRSFGKLLLEEQGEPLYAFPTPESLLAAAPEQLADCALGYRLPYVRAAAEAVATGKLDLKGLAALPDRELLDKLMEQYGVGIKVANCVALFAYGRTECAPVDVWIQRVIDEHYGGVNPFPRYGDAGILQQYMFYQARTEKTRSGRE